MQLWVDVYSPDGTERLGKRPIAAQSLSVTRPMDGIGSFSFSIPGLDPTSLELLTQKRRVRLFNDEPDGKREIGRGVIESIGVGDLGKSVTITGSDELSYLKKINARLGLTIKSVDISEHISTLTALAGWTASSTDIFIDEFGLTYDGDSVLRAIQRICELLGVHFRAGDNPSSIEYGYFGEDSGLRCVHVEAPLTPAINDNDDILLIDSLDIVTESKDLVNWVLPVGAGSGTAKLTLEHSTRTTPYTIQSQVADSGETYYFIEDADSIAAYGQSELVGTFKEIAPLSNTDLDIEAAANALYDATVAYLERHKDPYVSYRLSVKKVRQSIKPGDKIHIRYKGVINRDGAPFTWRDINADFWIIEVAETHDSSGDRLDLTIASIDRYEQDAASIILGGLEEIRVNNLKVQPSATLAPYVYTRDMKPSFPAIVPIRFTNATLDLQRILVRVKTRPLRVNASAAAASGDHRHVMFAPSLSAPVVSTYITCYAKNQSNSDIGVGFEWSGGTPAAGDEIRTWQGSGTHTHTLTYDINDDTTTPSTISVYVNGVDQTSALGGPFATTPNTPTTFDLPEDVLTELLRDDAGGLRQEHEIEFRCTTGKGTIEVLMEVFQYIQPILLG